MPVPKRSSGKHRLYTQHDIDTIKWLMARQEDGVTIKRAVELWRTIESEEQDPLVAMPLVTPAGSAGQPQFAVVGDTLNDARQLWIDACLDYDEARADAVLSQAFAMHAQEIVVFELIRRAVVEVGQGWHDGTVTVQQEHFTSELAIRKIEALIGAAAPPSRPERIIIGCPPNELHAFPALLLTYLLRRHGWRTIFLGANVPIEDFQSAVVQTKPNLVILVPQVLSSAATMLDMAAILTREGILMAYGGLVFLKIPALRTRFQGTYLGDTLESAPALIEGLFASPPRPMQIEPCAEEYMTALTHFREQVPFINAHIWRALRPNGVPPTAASIASANTRLATNISAALRLGSIDYLGSELSWQQLWVDDRAMPRALLLEYLQAYSRAVAAEMDERGAPILAWLKMIEKQMMDAQEAAVTV